MAMGSCLVPSTETETAGLWAPGPKGQGPRAKGAKGQGPRAKGANPQSVAFQLPPGAELLPAQNLLKSRGNRNST
jgi:hypothetical protein